MSLIVLHDAGPLGLITNPRSYPEAEECEGWLAMLVEHGHEVVIPEIADYEVRRELLRAEKRLGLARLNALKGMLSYLPITTPTMLQAAEFWAAARRLGRKTADDSALDADVILAAQAVMIAREGIPIVVATTNVRHLELFTVAKEWRSVT